MTESTIFNHKGVTARVSSIGQRGSVGQKVSIAGFLDRVGHL